MDLTCRLILSLVALALIGGGNFASAATLRVGADQTLKLPSDAAAVAKPGDTIEIEPGHYEDCAIWRQNNLTIMGTGPNVVIADKICAGKGIFVVDGDNALIRNLTLTGARDSEGNGAGLRAEGSGLKIEGVHFIGDEDGILSNPVSDSTIDIADSEFVDNGSCVNASGCAHGIYAGHIAMLRVRHSKFFENRDGHHIKSRAAHTELIDNDIQDGAVGTASYLVEISNGGSLLMEKNRLEKGPHCSNHSSAIVIGAEGVTQPTPELIIRNNDFTNDYPGEVVFVNNITATDAKLSGNRFTGKVRALAGDGSVN